MLACIEKIERFVSGKGAHDFAEDELLQSAVVRQLEVIGEAAKRVSEERRSKNPEIPWKDIAGMRDKLIHHYFDIDLNVVWKTITDDIPKLKRQLTSA
jgi:hypothetical protein